MERAEQGCHEVLVQHPPPPPPRNNTYPFEEKSERGREMVSLSILASFDSNVVANNQR